MCYQTHVRKNVCDKSKLCLKCGKLYYVLDEGIDALDVEDDDHNKQHRCGFLFCRQCDTYHPKERGCFVKHLKFPNKKADYRVVGFFHSFIFINIKKRKI